MFWEYPTSPIPAYDPGYVVQAPAGAAVGESTHPLVAISPTHSSQQRGAQGESALPREAWGGASPASGGTFLRPHHGLVLVDTEMCELRQSGMPAFMDGSSTTRSM
jgi:hypothetical protein